MSGYNDSIDDTTMPGNGDSKGGPDTPRTEAQAVPIPQPPHPPPTHPPPPPDPPYPPPPSLSCAAGPRAAWVPGCCC